MAAGHGASLFGEVANEAAGGTDEFAGATAMAIGSLTACSVVKR